MRFLSARSFAAVLPVVFVLTATSLVLTGCNSKPDDASATQGAYGEPAANVPAAPVGAPSASAPPVAATPADNATTPLSSSAGTTPSMPNAPFAGGAGGPMMGGGDPNAALTPTPDMDKKIADLQKGTDKKALAAAYADRGFARMNDANAGPRVKYRKALEDYRVALQNDATNVKARENKDLIEKIYREMNRPVPGEEGGTSGGTSGGTAK